MRRQAIGGILSLTVLLGACAPRAAEDSCSAATGQPMLIVDLFFGRAIHGRDDLTDAEWQDFQRSVITANLPAGYTVLDATGAWMNPSTRRTIEERTKVLVVAMPDTGESLTAVNRVRNEYQRQFHQQSVGMTVQRGCGAF